MEKDKVIKKTILAKIIIDLIANYEQNDDNDEIAKYKDNLDLIR